ncbi:hypothetical protein KHP57_15970 [Algiphilus sp. NNCM1]|jgi:hypothetical protein|nr:hypothetical protein [Algiphilus acroporae]
MPRPYQFKFISSGLGLASYRFWNGESEGRIEYRFSAEPYETSHFNGDRDRYAREIEASVNLLRRGISVEPIPQDLVDAFNEHRQREHDKYIDWLASKPDLLATIPADDPSRAAKVEPMVGAHYDCSLRRWVRNDESTLARTAAA